MLFGIGSEPVYNQNFLKTKTRSAGNEVTNFYGEKFSKVDSNHTCLAVISLDSALTKDRNYYPEVFLKKCKYIEKKVIRYINDKWSDCYFPVSLMKNKLEWVKFF